MIQITLSVHGMTCSGCQQTVERVLGELPGIDSVEVRLKEKQVVVSYDDRKLTEDNIKTAIEDIGYDVQ